MAARREPKPDEFNALRQELNGPAQVGPPAVTALPGAAGYVAEFKDALARITVESLRAGRDGLRGEVTVEAGPFGDGGWRVLTGGRLELNSISQRESWERRLRSRWPSCEWGSVLDRLCAAVLAAEKRLDAPAVLLRNVSRPAASGMLLEPLLLAGMPTIWYGDGGTMKSLLALAAGVSLQTGTAIIGRSEPATRRRVLYANFEPFDGWEHRDRMRRLLHFHEDDPAEVMPELAYVDCVGGTIVNQADRIRAAAREFSAEFLIIDSLTYAAEGPLVDDDTPRLYYRMLGYIGMPSLSLGHTPKNSNTDTPFGSVHWKNLCRLGWHFQRVEGKHGAEVPLKLTNKKWSTGPEVSDLGLMIRFGSDSIDIERSDAGPMVGAQEEHWKRIQSRLRVENVAMTYEELALALALEPDQVKKRVHEHKEAFDILPPAAGSRRARVWLADRRYHE